MKPANPPPPSAPLPADPYEIARDALALAEKAWPPHQGFAIDYPNAQSEAFHAHGRQHYAALARELIAYVDAIESQLTSWRAALATYERAESRRDADCAANAILALERVLEAVRAARSAQ